MNELPVLLGSVNVPHATRQFSGPRITLTQFIRIGADIVAVDFWTNEAGVTVRIDAPRTPRAGEWNGSSK